MAKGELYDGSFVKFSKILDGEEFDNVVWFYSPQPVVDQLWINKNFKSIKHYKTKAGAEVDRQPGFLYWIELRGRPTR